MSSNVLKAYLPMTETMYYILLSLLKPMHGYGVILHVRGITGGRVSISPGTVYNSLAKLIRDGLIVPAEETERRKLYIVSDSGISLLRLEISRLRELHINGETALKHLEDRQ